MHEELSVRMDFYNQPTIEEKFVPEFSHVDVDILFDDDFAKFFEVRTIFYKNPIFIPRIKLAMLDEPVVDKVFEKDTLFDKESLSETVFPEDLYRFMYRETMKGATLESFIDDRWDEEFRQKVRSFYQRHGLIDWSNDSAISKVLSVTKQMEDGLEIIRIGAERRDKTLIEFT